VAEPRAFNRAASAQYRVLEAQRVLEGLVGESAVDWTEYARLVALHSEEEVAAALG
jgi:hypothetical protein